MHVWDGIWQKVHYNAVFGDGKRGKSALNAVPKDRDVEGAERKSEEDKKGRS
jgi:hypothetical protein